MFQYSENCSYYHCVTAFNKDKTSRKRLLREQNLINDKSHLDVDKKSEICYEVLLHWKARGSHALRTELSRENCGIVIVNCRDEQQYVHQ
jgi:hypothetical protein